jgi:hypothetical protein
MKNQRKTYYELVNYLLDLNNSLNEVWKFHPENPDRIDIVNYHNILISKIEKITKEIDEFKVDNE